MRPLDPEFILADLLVMQTLVQDAPPILFDGFMASDIADWKGSMVGELRLDAAFKLLTWLESVLRRDFNASITEQRGDPLSRSFESYVEDELGRANASLDKVLRDTSVVRVLDLIVEHISRTNGVELSAVCKETRKYYSGFRNWYAHGRYFSVQPYPPDPQILLERVLLLANSVTAFHR
jgi:hypothetical protein